MRKCAQDTTEDTTEIQPVEKNTTLATSLQPEFTTITIENDVPIWVPLAIVFIVTIFVIVVFVGYCCWRFRRYCRQIPTTTIEMGQTGHDNHEHNC